MLNQFSRTQLLVGKESLDKLQNSRVAIFGIGGVGGYTVEALARSGIGTFDLIDDDKVCLTNLNRQILALHSTIGKYKVDVMEERIHDINPDAVVYKHRCFYLPETSNEFDLNSLDITTRKLYDSCNEDMKKKILERVKNYVSINKNNNTKYELYMFHINEDTSIYETIVDNDFIIGVGQKIENELKNKRNDKKYKLELKKIIDNTSNEEYEFETPSNDDEDMTDFSSSLENKTVDVENTSTPTNKHINSDMYDEDNDEDEDDDDPFDWN